MSNYGIVRALRDNTYSLTISHNGTDAKGREYVLVEVVGEEEDREFSVCLYAEGPPEIYAAPFSPSREPVENPLEWLTGRERLILEAFGFAPLMVR